MDAQIYTHCCVCMYDIYIIYISMQRKKERVSENEDYKYRRELSMLYNTVRILLS